MDRARSFLGYLAAVLTLVVTVLTPFVMLPAFTRAVGSLGVRENPAYSGGQVSRVIHRGAYQIEIYHPVRRKTPFQRMDPFVQVAWGPAGALPERVSEELDLDGDGRADLAIDFQVPRDPKAPLQARFQSPSGFLRSSGLLRIRNLSTAGLSEEN